MELLENQKQKQEPATVEIPSSRNQALASIDLHVQRHVEAHKQYPTLVQVGKELFEAAFPDRHYPHKVGEIGEVCIFPRPDLLGPWQIVTIAKPSKSIHLGEDVNGSNRSKTPAETNKPTDGSPVPVQADSGRGRDRV